MAPYYCPACSSDDPKKCLLYEQHKCPNHRRAPHIPSARAGEATVSEAEVEAFCTAYYAGWPHTQSEHNDDLRTKVRACLENTARARAAAQGAGAQPVACSVCGGSGVEEVYGGHGTVLELPCSACAAPPDAPRPDIEAARREERERCAEIIRRCFTLPQAAEVRDELVARICTGDRP